MAERVRGDKRLSHGQFFDLCKWIEVHREELVDNKDWKDCLAEAAAVIKPNHGVSDGTFREAAKKVGVILVQARFTQESVTRATPLLKAMGRAILLLGDQRKGGWPKGITNQEVQIIRDFLKGNPT